MSEVRVDGPVETGSLDGVALGIKRSGGRSLLPLVDLILAAEHF